VFTVLAWRVLPVGGGAGNVPRLPFRRLAFLAAGVLCVGFSGRADSLVAKIVLVAAAIFLVFNTFRLDAAAANRLFPMRALSLSGPVGTAYWIFFLVSMTYSPINVFLPLMVQVLHGASALVAGYINTVFALAWTSGAILSSGLQGRHVRTAIAVGPLVILVGVAGQGVVFDDGPLPVLATFVLLTGLGIGISHAHIVNWTMSAADAGEESVTASSIPTMRSLGIAFGAAFAGLVANAAGLAAGVSPASVATAAGWIYGLCLLGPVVMSVLAWRLLRLHGACETTDEAVSRLHGE
jgi:hypothetical protein